MNTPRFTIGKHSHGQTAIFDSVGLVCTMEAGSQSKRDTDAAYIIKLEADRAALIAALDAVAGLARSFPRPSGMPELCRMLLDIDGIARATLAQVRS